MEIEIQGVPRSMKSQYQARLKVIKADLTRCRKLSEDLRSQLARSELLPSRTILDGWPSSDEPYGSTGDRTRLLAGMDILSDGSRRLLESQAIALETEEQGADILRSLRGQREQIENARDTVGKSRCFRPILYYQPNSSELLILQLIVLPVHSRR
jgi:vesicle transport through interaction with t-SNAREs protein 1